VTLAPRLLFVWSAKGEGLLNFGDYASKNVLSNINAKIDVPHISFIPEIIFYFYIVVMFVLFIIIILDYFKKIGMPTFNLKKKKEMTKITMNKGSREKILPVKLWFFSSLFFFLVFYLTTRIIKDPYYFMRMRTLQPFFIFPVFAFGVYNLYVATKKLFFEKNINKKVFDLLYVFSIIFIFIMIAVPDYIETVKHFQYEHIDMAQWDAYSWVHENTDKGSWILFFPITSQSERIYIKRKSATIKIEEYQRLLNVMGNENKTPTIINGKFSGGTPRHAQLYEKSFWEYERYELPYYNNEEGKLNVLDFDYLIFLHMDQQFAEVNNLFASGYVQEYGFVPVYNQGGYLILKNEKGT